MKFTELEVKYEIIKAVVRNYNDSSFTHMDVFNISSMIARKHNIDMEVGDVKRVIFDLYDKLYVNRVELEDGSIGFRNSLLFNEYSGKISSR